MYIINNIFSEKMLSFYNKNYNTQFRVSIISFLRNNFSISDDNSASGSSNNRLSLTYLQFIYNTQ